MPPRLQELPDSLIMTTMKKLSLKDRVALSATNKYFKKQFDENFKSIKYYFKKGIATYKPHILFDNLTLDHLTTHFWRPRRNSGIPAYIKIVSFDFSYENYRGSITVHYDSREFDEEGNDLEPSIKFVKFQCREFHFPDNIQLSLSRKKPDDFALEYKIIDHPDRTAAAERVKNLLYITLAGYEKCRTTLKNRNFYGQNVAIPTIENKHTYLSLYNNPQIHQIFGMTYSQSTPKSSSKSS